MKTIDVYAGNCNFHDVPTENFIHACDFKHKIQIIKPEWDMDYYMDYYIDCLFKSHHTKE